MLCHKYCNMFSGCLHASFFVTLKTQLDNLMLMSILDFLCTTSYLTLIIWNNDWSCAAGEKTSVTFQKLTSRYNDNSSAHAQSGCKQHHSPRSLSSNFGQLWGKLEYNIRFRLPYWVVRLCCCWHFAYKYIRVCIFVYVLIVCGVFASKCNGAV